jgi:hypothetical protein
MEPLWRALDRLGIRPGGVDDADEEPPAPPVCSRDAEADEFQAGSQADAGHPANDVKIELGADDELVADYVTFTGTAGPDPRTGGIGAVADGLCEIIDAEGPMIAKRAYDVYLTGCGIRRLGGELQGTMNRALATAIGQGRVISDNVTSRGGLVLSTVRSKDAPAVRPRRRGPRSFDEIPPGELRAVAERLSAALDLQPGSVEHLRAIVQAMDLPLMLSQVGTALEADIALTNVGAPDGPAAGPLEQRRA